MKNTKNIIILALSVLVILFSIYEISNIYSKPNLVSGKSVETRKELDIYALGYKEDDGKARSEITKRIRDFYCKTLSYYDTVTKEDEIGSYYCGKISGPVVVSSSDSIDCVAVLSVNTPKGLDSNLDICFDIKDTIQTGLIKKYSLKSSDKLNVNFIKGNFLNDTFKLGVQVNCKDNPKNDPKIYDENQGCAGVEFAAKKKTGEWVLVGLNDSCKEEEYICKNIEMLAK
jgi:hypothetical protein